MPGDLPRVAWGDGRTDRACREKAGYRRRLAGLRALLPVAPVDDAVELSRWVLGGGNLAGAAGLHKARCGRVVLGAASIACPQSAKLVAEIELAELLSGADLDPRGGGPAVERARPRPDDDAGTGGIRHHSHSESLDPPGSGGRNYPPHCRPIRCRACPVSAGCIRRSCLQHAHCVWIRL